MAAIEYAAVLAVVALVIGLAAAALTDAEERITAATACVVDRVLAGGEGDCAVALGLDGGDGEVDPRAAAVLAALEGLRDYAGTGSATQALYEQIAAAVEAGDLDRAEELLAQLALYEDLVGTEGRGHHLADLFGTSDGDFDALMAEGTIYFDGGAYNTTYFRLENPPGGGVVVMDYFIDSSTSGLVLRGDDRDHLDPLRDGLTVDESRMVLVVDLETGRGQVLVSETCTSGVSVCNEPRPNVVDGSFWSDDTGTRPVIPILPNDYDIANQFTFGDAENGFSLDYDALNGIIPVGSVDGRITVHVGEDGQLRIGEDDRDDYPSIGTYYYTEPGQTQVVQQRGQESVVCGALPVNLC